MKRLLTDWRIHLLAFVLTVIAEMIGRIRFDFGVAAFSLFPMFYALILGAILGGAKLISTEMMEKASPFGSVCFMMVVAKCGTGIGPNLDIVKQAGIAMILQEFGSIFTVILAMPVAILIFHMGRAAVGCSFSISREEGIAIIGGKYGLDSQEGVGVMGGYVTGTILGTLFLGIVTSLIASLQLFHPYALAMACGAGSTSMMTAGIASVIEYYPDMADQITAFATSSNVLSSVDSFYKYLFITLPMCNVIYRLLTSGNKHYKNGVPVKGSEQSTQPEKEGKFISTMKSGEGITPPEAFPGLIVLAVCVLLGCLLHEMVDMALPKNLPDIVYISLVAILVSIPGLFPFSDICNVWIDKVDLMSLITVLMAYTGILIGKDLGTFKQQGAVIVIVALITFFGTFIGSVLIGQTVLGLSGVI